MAFPDFFMKCAGEVIMPENSGTPRKFRERNSGGTGSPALNRLSP